MTDGEEEQYQDGDQRKVIQEPQLMSKIQVMMKKELHYSLTEIFFKIATLQLRQNHYRSSNQPVTPTHFAIIIP